MVELMILSGFFVIPSICGLLADHILPHIKPLNDFIDSLPLMADEAESGIYISRKENKAA